MSLKNVEKTQEIKAFFDAFALTTAAFAWVAEAGKKTGAPLWRPQTGTPVSVEDAAPRGGQSRRATDYARRKHKMNDPGRFNGERGMRLPAAPLRGLIPPAPRGRQPRSGTSRANFGSIASSSSRSSWPLGLAITQSM